jgi:hypothetical protein
MKSVRTIIDSNGVPYLQITSVGWQSTSGRAEVEMMGYGYKLVKLSIILYVRTGCFCVSVTFLNVL